MIPSSYNFFKLHFILLLLFLFNSPCCLADQSLADETLADKSSAIEIAVNSSVPDKLYSLTDARAIFAMRKIRWPDGTRIQVFVLPDNDPLHRQFTKSRLNMFPHQFRRIWDKLIFSGTGQAPHPVESMAEMLEKISTTPGAIGYLNKQPNNKNIRSFNYE